MIQFLEFQKHVKVWSDDLVSWKPNSFDLGSDVPELVPSVSDMIVDSEYFAVRPDNINIGFLNGPSFRYGNFFIPRVEKTSKNQPTERKAFLSRAVGKSDFFSLVQQRFHDLFLKMHGNLSMAVAYTYYITGIYDFRMGQVSSMEISSPPKISPKGCRPTGGKAFLPKD